MFEQQPFRLPAEMTFILKSLTTLDGIARILDPKYSLVVCASPFVKSLTTLPSHTNTFGELARQAREFVKFKLQQPSKAEQLIQRIEQRIEEGELRVRVRSVESDRALRRVNLALKSLIHACWSGFAGLCGIALLIGNYNGWAIAILSLSGFGLFLFLRSLFNLSIRERLDRMTE
jgi:predicted unusual protein kinase regulating ubiquinone biosynthesis (AarF/ABC1/UbiB family)